jgi:RNA polymerase sigma factor (TIGR02999 family)
MLAGMPEVTQLLNAVEAGDRLAADRLLPLVYDELRRLAAARLAGEAAGHTLGPTALVHEAYLRLVDRDEPPTFANRRHFFAAAAEAMRRILVESARRKHSLKRGGGRARVEIDAAELALPEPREDLLALDEALDRFAEVEPLKADLVKLRYFVGMTGAEAAEALGISDATAERWWAYARAWLYRQIAERDATREIPDR